MLGLSRCIASFRDETVPSVRYTGFLLHLEGMIGWTRLVIGLFALVPGARLRSAGVCTRTGLISMTVQISAMGLAGGCWYFCKIAAIETALRVSPDLRCDRCSRFKISRVHKRE